MRFIRFLRERILIEKKYRNWLWIFVAIFVALQIYFVQAMLAALLLFTGVFAVVAALALALYMVDRAGQWTLGWASRHSDPVWQLARGSWTRLETLSKKPFRRQRSEI